MHKKSEREVPGHRQLRHSSSSPHRSEPRPISQSERDWAHVKSALENGADPEELIVELARSRANDKSDPNYYARLTVTKALADLRMSSMPSSDAEERESQH